MYGIGLTRVISLLVLLVIVRPVRHAAGFRPTVTCTAAPVLATTGVVQGVKHPVGKLEALQHLRPTPGQDPAARRRQGRWLLRARRHEVDIDIDIGAVEPRRRDANDISIRIPPFYTEEHRNDNDNELLLSENDHLDGARSAKVSGVPPYSSPLHHIHVVPLLSHGEAETCLQLATQHASHTNCWDRPDFQRHESYATCDFCVDDCDALRAYCGRIGFQRRILDDLAARYRVDTNDLEFLDLFCAHYVAKAKPAAGTADPPTQGMDRLEPHRDGSVLSFTVLLSPPSNFEGGGTFFDALRDEPANDNMCLHEGGVVRPKFAGDAVLHSGKLLHGADAVTRGSRTVLVGFVSADRWQRQGALASACREWGRMDVARWRGRRHERQGGRDGTTGWPRSAANRMWLPNQQQGRSDIRSCCPNLASVWRRADPEFQRRYKLRAEDMLLRRILLDAPRDLPGVPLGDDALPAFDGVTVL
jgi:hypothetical protein